MQIGSNDVVEDTYFVLYGSTYGRFIFTADRATAIEVPANVENASIRNCTFMEFGTAIHLHA
jgi:hypothetical protein